MAINVTITQPKSISTTITQPESISVTTPTGATTSADAITLSSIADFAYSDLQSAIEELVQRFFQQEGTPTAGLNEGDIWFDVATGELKVYS